MRTLKRKLDDINYNKDLLITDLVKRISEQHPTHHFKDQPNASPYTTDITPLCGRGAFI